MHVLLFRLLPLPIQSDLSLNQTRTSEMDRFFSSALSYKQYVWPFIGTEIQ